MKTLMVWEMSRDCRHNHIKHEEDYDVVENDVRAALE
jgi:hypothetical protein